MDAPAVGHHPQLVIGLADATGWILGMSVEQVAVARRAVGVGLVRATVLLAAFVGPLSPRGRSQTGTELEQAKLLAGNGQAGDRLGYAVSVDGGTAVLGAPYSNFGGDNSGSARVFVRNGRSWVLQATLVDPHAAPQQFFGNSVSIDGDTVVVGAVRDNAAGSEAGSVYVFERSGTSWNLNAWLVPDDISPNDRFGVSVSVRGDTAVVGSWWDDDAGTSSGSAYVFQRTGCCWTQRGKLVGSDTAAGDRFGAWVALDGNTVLVEGDSKIYVFVKSGSSWAEQAILVPGDRSPVHRPSISGDRAVATAGVGSIKIFERTGTTWREQPELSVCDGSFSNTAYMDGDIIVASVSTGSACVYERDGSTWIDRARLAASDGSTLRAVAVASRTVLAGALENDDTANNAGAGFVFDLPLVVSTYCTAKTNSLGCVPFLTTNGKPSASSTQPFRIVSNQVLPGEAGFLLYGSKKANLAFHGGRLCIKAPASRLLPLKVAKQDGVLPCEGILRSNFNSRIQSSVDPTLTVGATVFAQWVQRDPADPAGFGDSFTDGVQFAIMP